ncbi:hypothetical protein MKX01_001323 [Papaver californicum]|nr:hypothetical protein MKX01_001323 [Papaver californicum]
MVELWHPLLPKGWPTACIDRPLHTSDEIKNSTNFSIVSEHQFSPHSPPSLLPNRVYKTNGYLRISCNGGLNQMRAAICDMVTVARYLNLTLLVPELDKTSFWADPSDFKDIFNIKHFINSLRDEIRIVKLLPKKFNRKTRNTVYSMPPVSWSTEKYYTKQKLRCGVNYQALRFTPLLEDLGSKLISILKKSGVFVVLHLRYEMDMLAFSGCTHGCSVKETKELTEMRYAYPCWKEKEIVSEKKRLEGPCPLTPEEIALVLQTLGFARGTRIYIASGEIYGGERRLATLRAAYPNLVRKEMLLSRDDLRPFQNHSTQMAVHWITWSLLPVMFLFPVMIGVWRKLLRATAGTWVLKGPSSWIGRSWWSCWICTRITHSHGMNSQMLSDMFEHRMGQPTIREVIPDRTKAICILT